MKGAVILLVVAAACADAAAPDITPFDPPTTAASTTAAPPTTAAVTTTTAAASSTTAPFQCFVTVPEPGFVPPEPWPPKPTDGIWYGSEDLWTVLPADGVYHQRKGVWWSINFPGGAVEEQPEISATWMRLDTGAVHHHEAPGTNAYTPQDGDFMIAGIDPEEPGCWEVTATYKGATLSYVYRNG